MATAGSNDGNRSLLNLPLELRRSVWDELPPETQDNLVHEAPEMANFVFGARAREQRNLRNPKKQREQGSNELLPTFSSADIFLNRMPLEIRRHIYSYLMPDKKEIVPVMEPKERAPISKETIEAANRRAEHLRNTSDAAVDSMSGFGTSMRASAEHPQRSHDALRVSPLNRKRFAWQRGIRSKFDSIRSKFHGTEPDKGLGADDHSSTPSVDEPEEEEADVGATAATMADTDGEADVDGSDTQLSKTPRPVMPLSRYSKSPFASSSPDLRTNIIHSESLEDFEIRMSASGYGPLVAPKTKPNQPMDDDENAPSPEHQVSVGQSRTVDRGLAFFKSVSFLHPPVDDVEDDRTAMRKHIARCTVRGKYRSKLTPAQGGYTGTSTVMRLLLVNSQIAVEVATMLYEESKFEIYVSRSGIRFLDVPLVPRLNEFGFKLEKGDSKFGQETVERNDEGKIVDVKKWTFSFARVQKLRLVIFGGEFIPPSDSADRTVGMWGECYLLAKKRCIEIRQLVKDLMQLLRAGNMPHLVELEVVMRDGEPGLLWEKEVDDREKKVSSFWHTDQDEFELRSSILAVDGIAPANEPFCNVNFVLQPIEALRGLSKFGVTRELSGKCWSTVHEHPMPKLEEKITSHNDYTEDATFSRHVAQLEEAHGNFETWMQGKTEEERRVRELAECEKMDKIVDEWQREAEQDFNMRHDDDDDDEDGMDTEDWYGDEDMSDDGGDLDGPD